MAERRGERQHIDVETANAPFLFNFDVHMSRSNEFVQMRSARNQDILLWVDVEKIIRDGTCHEITGASKKK